MEKKHLRERLKQTKPALEKETDERKEEAPVLQNMPDDRVAMLTVAFRPAYRQQREVARQRSRLLLRQLLRAGADTSRQRENEF